MTRRLAAPAREQGFVLVGVVMFVLALGILSLSLFSLSSYEASFFQGSLDDERARQRAAGGVELVKSLVAMSPDQLERAKLAEGRLGIVYAKAWQMVSGVADSTGPVDESRHVFFRVKTLVNGTARMVEGEYVPASVVNPYKRLITSNGLIFYNAVGGSPITSRIGTTVLERPIWQTVDAGADTAWTSFVSWPEGRPLKTETAPVADVTSFFAANLTGGTQTVAWIDQFDPDEHVLRLDAGGSSATRYFRSPPLAPSAAANTPLSTYFDFYDNPDDFTEIQVRGTCIWMVPAGVRFDSKVKIVRQGGGSETNLVIVAGPNGRHPAGPNPQDNYPDVGIWFFNGLDIADGDGVRVWLVTDGELRLEHYDDAANDESDARGLNIFADGVFLMGPRLGSGETLHMRYRLSGDARVDYMTAAGALPTFGGAAGLDFQLVAGSWREY